MRLIGRNFMEKQSHRKSVRQPGPLSEERYWIDIGQAKTDEDKDSKASLQTLQNNHAQNLVSEENLSKPVKAGRGWRPELKGLSLQACMEKDISSLISGLLQMPAKQLEVETNLADYGADSISLTQLAQELYDTYAINIEPSVFFSYGTIKKISVHLTDKYTAQLQAFYQESNTALASPTLQPLPVATHKPEKKTRLYSPSPATLATP